MVSWYTKSNKMDDNNSLLNQTSYKILSSMDWIEFLQICPPILGLATQTSNNISTSKYMIVPIYIYIYIFVYQHLPRTHATISEAMMSKGMP